MSESKLMKIGEVAAMLGISQAMVRTLSDQGKIPVAIVSEHGTRYYSKPALDKFLSGYKEPTVCPHCGKPIHEKPA